MYYAEQESSKIIIWERDFEEVNLIPSIIFSLSAQSQKLIFKLKKPLNMQWRMFLHYPYYCNALPCVLIYTSGFGEAKKALGYAAGRK
jgi:hypothetical protein